LLCFTLLLSLVSGLFSAEAFASESKRFAKIESLKGEVLIKKAGGSKEYKAYRNMTLNQGDHIKTGDNSQVVLQILDHDDEVTISANASLYLSQLQDKDGKISKMTIWSGSTYVKAGKLNSKDEFLIE